MTHINLFIFIIIIIISFWKILTKFNIYKKILKYKYINIIYNNKFIYTWLQSLNNIYLPTIIILLFRWFIYEPFFIPSSSMMPTLLNGDFIIVEKFTYNLHNPFNDNIWIYTNEPQYGDIVVFKYPKNPNIYYIKRIIGLPLDKITYNEITKQITIHKPCLYNTKKYCATNNITYTNIKNSKFITEFIQNNNIYTEYIWEDNDIIKKHSKNSIIIPLIEKTEYINNIPHQILLIPNNYLSYINNKKKKYIKTWIIPKNMYFVMGDYRDNSQDSRYWGYLDKKLLIGKAKYIWFSINKQENYWPTSFRIKRIGNIY